MEHRLRLQASGAALEQARGCGAHSLAAPGHGGSPRTRDRTCVSCVGRCSLIHPTPRKPQKVILALRCPHGAPGRLPVQPTSAQGPLPVRPTRAHLPLRCPVSARRWTLAGGTKGRSGSRSGGADGLPASGSVSPPVSLSASHLPRRPPPSPHPHSEAHTDQNRAQHVRGKKEIPVLQIHFQSPQPARKLSIQFLAKHLGFRGSLG